jgi:hypothetical protein
MGEVIRTDMEGNRWEQCAKMDVEVSNMEKCAGRIWKVTAGRSVTG